MYDDNDDDDDDYYYYDGLLPVNQVGYLCAYVTSLTLMLANRKFF